MANNTQNTVLLIMDMQNTIVAMVPGGADHVLAKASKAIAHARANNIPVIYVVVGFRQGIPEISPNNRTFGAFKERLAQADMQDFIQIHPQVAPQSGEVTVVKRRVSAFTGSDLEVLLRAYGAQHLVLAGLSTSGVVLSTLREAADKDFRLTVLSDSCADSDADVHQLLMTKVFARQADVVTVDEWTSK